MLFKYLGTISFDTCRINLIWLMESGPSIGFGEFSSKTITFLTLGERVKSALNQFKSQVLYTKLTLSEEFKLGLKIVIKDCSNNLTCNSLNWMRNIASPLLNL